MYIMHCLRQIHLNYGNTISSFSDVLVISKLRAYSPNYGNTIILFPDLLCIFFSSPWIMSFGTFRQHKNINPFFIWLWMIFHNRPFRLDHKTIFTCKVLTCRQFLYCNKLIITYLRSSILKCITAIINHYSQCVSLYDNTLYPNWLL